MHFYAPMTLLHTVQTFPFTLRSETIVKEAWWSFLFNTFAYLVLTLGAAGGSLAIVYLWFNDLAPQKVGGLGVLCGLLFCLGLTLIGYALLCASLKRSNWLLRIRPQELMIKFRSDMNARLPEPHPIVVVLAYSQIRWARSTCEWVRHYSLHTADGPSEYRASFLDLKLQLSAEELERLRQAIEVELQYRPGAGNPTMFAHFPVRLDGDVLRVQWWRGLRPKLDAIIELLIRYVPVERALDLTVNFTQVVSPNEARQKMLELARRGEQLAAIGLARRYHSLSLSEAKIFVEDLKGDPKGLGPT